MRPARGSAPAGGSVVVVNPSPRRARRTSSSSTLDVPAAWAAVALRAADRWLPTQQVDAARDHRSASHRVHGDAGPASSSPGDATAASCSAARSTGPRRSTTTPDTPRDPSSCADDPADPPEFDVERLARGGGGAPRSPGPTRHGRSIVRASGRRRLLARCRRAGRSGSPGRPRRMRPATAGRARGAPGRRRPARAAQRPRRASRSPTTARSSLRGGGVELAGVGRIVDGGDSGDSYNYGPPADDLLVDRPLEVVGRRRERGAARGAS